MIQELYYYSEITANILKECEELGDSLLNKLHEVCPLEITIVKDTSEIEVFKGSLAVKMLMAILSIGLSKDLSINDILKNISFNKDSNPIYQKTFLAFATDNTAELKSLLLADQNLKIAVPTGIPSRDDAFALMLLTSEIIDSYGKVMSLLMESCAKHFFPHRFIKKDEQKNEQNTKNAATTQKKHSPWIGALMLGILVLAITAAFVFMGPLSLSLTAKAAICGGSFLVATLTGYAAITSSRKAQAEIDANVSKEAKDPGPNTVAKTAATTASFAPAQAVSQSIKAFAEASDAKTRLTNTPRP